MVLIVPILATISLFTQKFKKNPKIRKSQEKNATCHIILLLFRIIVWVSILESNAFDI